MRKLAAWVLVLGMAMSPAAMAADGNDKTSDAKTDKTTTNTNTTKPNGTAPTSTELEAEIEQLRALIKEQADQLAAMKAAMTNGSTANSGTTTSTAANSAATSNVAGCIFRCDHCIGGAAGNIGASSGSICDANVFTNGENFWRNT